MPEQLPGRISSRLTNFGVPEVCWEWTGSRTRGYGTVRYRGSDWYVHRVIYTSLVGEIPPGLEVDHLCRNTICANPAHLEPVTPAENRRRAARARDPQEFCLRGHRRTPDNLTPSRNCRKCARLRWRANNPEPPPRTHCKRGHELTPENTYVPPGTNQRQCRECKNAMKRAARKRRTAHQEEA